MKNTCHRVIFCLLVFFVSTQIVSAVEVDFQFSLTGVECFDGVDNDNDGVIDYPNDPDCTSSLSDDEGEDVVSEPDPEPDMDEVSGSGSTGTLPSIDSSEPGVSNEIEDQSTVIDRITRPIQELIRNIIPGVTQEESQEISLFFEINERDTQVVKSQQPTNDTDIIPIQKITRFTLPTTQEPSVQIDNENLVFEGPVLITFFDVQTALVVDRATPEVPQNSPLLLIILVFVGIIFVARFVVHEYSEEGIQEEIYAPCSGRLVFSLSSVIFLFVLIYLGQNFYSNSVTNVHPKDNVSVVTALRTNNVIENQELVVNHIVNGISHKQLVEVEGGVEVVTFQIPEEFTKDVSIETVVSRDAFNTFISELRFKESQTTDRQKILLANLLVGLGLISEFVEMYIYHRKRQEL